jgi:di/tricarboxylate transporter
VLFVWNRWPVEVVAIGSALALYALGVIDLDGAVSGFGDPTVVLIASLFVVSEGLDATGVTTWVGQLLVAQAASFLTPVATPANMMITGPTGYRFGDYWKLGLPLIGVFFLVAVGLVPLVWSF